MCKVKAWIIERMGSKIGLDGEAMSIVRYRVKSQLIENEAVIKQTTKKLRATGIER